MSPELALSVAMLLAADAEWMSRLDEGRNERGKERVRMGCKLFTLFLVSLLIFLKANVFFFSTPLLINTVICGLKISINNLELE